MRFPSRLLLTALLVLGQPALADQRVSVTGATINWFGFYKSVEKEIKDSDISTGQRYTGTDIVPPKANTDQITLTPKTTFGFGFTLIGGPANGQVVLKQVYKYPSPGMPRGKTGEFVPDDQLPFTYRIGGENVMGYNTGSNPSSWPTGIWTFQLWSGDKLVAEKNFTVSRP
jgi:hypothetical protein